MNGLHKVLVVPDLLSFSSKWTVAPVGSSFAANALNTVAVDSVPSSRTGLDVRPWRSKVKFSVPT